MKSNDGKPLGNSPRQKSKSLGHEKTGGQNGKLKPSIKIASEVREIERRARRVRNTFFIFVFSFSFRSITVVRFVDCFE